MSKVSTTISDDPISEAKLFGFDKKSDEIVEFLVSEQTSTPFVIAINGEWGSGKSSLLLTIQKKLEEKVQNYAQKLKIVYFDAWEYENTNPAAALVYNLTKPLEKPGSGVAMSIGCLALDVITRNTINMPIGEMKNHFKQSITAVTSFTEEVRRVINSSLKDGRLIVLIDDLDRCTIENTLEILNSLKLFLSLEQCIFVVAVDMKKIELAWKTRYGKDNDLLDESTSYLEKIFQIRTSIPPKRSIRQMREYVQSIVKDIPYEIADMVATAGPKNLRKVKRLLNLASFLSKSGENKLLKYELAVIWVIFEYLMKSNSLAITVANRMSNETGISFVKWIGENTQTKSLDLCNNHIRSTRAFQTAQKIISNNDELIWRFLQHAKKIIQKNSHDYTLMEYSFEEILEVAEDAIE